MMDNYERDSQCLDDYKITRPASLMYDKTDHIMQLNVLKYLCEANGYPVKKLQNVYIFPHLDNKYVGTKEGYPTQNIMKFEREILPRKQVEDFIKERVRLHIANLNRKDKELDKCSDRERWIREEYWKVYLRKKGGKKGEVQDFSSKAAYTFTEEAQLTEFLDTTDLEASEILVKQIKSEPKGCEYCKGAPFCYQLRAEQREKRESAPTFP